jgi:hypothetical protein
MPEGSIEASESVEAYRKGDSKGDSKGKQLYNVLVLSLTMW